ncbi:MAG: hypothetical protein E7812_13415 [Phenylobacterium sp.]|nr:MAG: hypothetical protein E7812_13415 [Phenylobacterium sp.]
MLSIRRLGLAAAAAFLIASPALAQSHDGDWAGVLKVPSGQQLRLLLHVATTGSETIAVLDSLDQGVSIPAAAYKADGNKASILFLAIGGELVGEYAPDGKTFTGTFTQGLSMPLTLTKTEAAPAKP